MPCRLNSSSSSSSRAIDSSPVTANVKEALPANRVSGEPVRRAAGTIERMSRMKVSRASASPKELPMRACSATSRATARPTIPATAHCVPFDGPEARRGLAGVDDARAGASRLGDVPGSERGDAAHSLDEIEADPFGLQHGTGGTRHLGQHRAGLEGDTVFDQSTHPDAGMREHHGSREDRSPG